MNKKVVIGAGAASAILLTVVVFQFLDDDALTTVRPHGGAGAPATQVAPGERLTLDSRGAARVAPAAGDTTTSGAAPLATSGASVSGVAEPAAIPAGAHVLRGVVVDAVSGGAVAGASVALRTNADPPAVLGTTATDAEGAFQFALPSGTTEATILAGRERYAEATLEWSAPEEAGAAAAPASTTLPEVRVALLHETALAGIVREAADGAPISSYLLTVHRYDPVTREWFEPALSQVTAEDGIFYAGPLEPGNYRVWAYREGRHRSAGVEVKLAANEFRGDLEITLAEGCALNGRVVARHTGQPVAGAVVFAPKAHLPGTVNHIERKDVDPRVRDAALTAADGTFRLQDLPPSDALVVRVLHADYKPTDVEVALAPGAVAAPVEIALAEGTSIRGRVLDDKGEALTGATVMAFTMVADEAMTESGMTQVGEDGTYELRHLNPGMYIVIRLIDLEEKTDPNNFRMTTVRLGADRDAEVDFVEVAQLATLRGRVLDEKGEPIAGMGISASTVEGGDLSFRYGMSDESGRYEIKNLQLALYTITLSRAETRTMTAVETIRFESAKDYERDLVLTDLKLVGTVHTPEGKAPPYYEIYALKKGPDGRDQWSGMIALDESGAFEMGGLPPGEYRLFATAQGYVRAVSAWAELDAKTKREARLELRLEPGAGVRVTVRDKNDEPAAGVVVAIFGADKRQVNVGLPPKSDGQGQYVYHSLAAGEYTVRVTVPGAAEPVTASFQAAVGEVRELTVSLP